MYINYLEKRKQHLEYFFGKSMIFMSNTSNLISLIKNKGVLSVLITLSIVAVLVFDSSPAQALTVTVANPNSGYLGSAYTFAVSINVENTDLLPIQHVNLQIFNAASPSTYRSDCTNLPLPQPHRAHH